MHCQAVTLQDALYLALEQIDVLDMLQRVRRKDDVERSVFERDVRAIIEKNRPGRLCRNRRCSDVDCRDIKAASSQLSAFATRIRRRSREDGREKPRIAARSPLRIGEAPTGVAVCGGSSALRTGWRSVSVLDKADGVIGAARHESPLTPAGRTRCARTMSAKRWRNVPRRIGESTTQRVIVRQALHRRAKGLHVALETSHPLHPLLNDLAGAAGR